MSPPKSAQERAEEYAKVRTGIVRGTGDDEIRESVSSALLFAWLSGHSAGVADLQPLMTQALMVARTWGKGTPGAFLSEMRRLDAELTRLKTLNIFPVKASKP